MAAINAPKMEGTILEVFAIFGILTDHQSGINLWIVRLPFNVLKQMY
jgi:hypothetical protein